MRAKATTPRHRTVTRPPPTAAEVAPPVAIAPAVATAIAAFERFLGGLDPVAPLTILCHSDADGLASGAVLQRGLARRGHARIATLVTGRGENAWGAAVRERLAATAPAALIVADLGSRAAPLLPGVPTLLIDHHRPEGTPDGATLISAYDWEAIPNTSLLAFWLVAAGIPADDLLWIAAVGTLSDLGDDAPFAIIPTAKRAYTAKWLREATALVNAARRAPAMDTATALAALLGSASPRALADPATSPAVATLQRYRDEVNAALAEAGRQAPLFSGEVALIRIDTPCQIHPLIAQRWRGRLPGYIVICVNSGYVPGRVSFSARTASGRNLLDFLAAARPAGLEAAEYGHGHDQASGGALPDADWNRFLAGLGFPERAFIRRAQPQGLNVNE
jgi:single-stranded-DNA-specific exonuclease